MEKESLSIAREVVLHAISDTEIKIEDRVELLINLREFLSTERYEESIKELKKTNKKVL